MAVIPAKAGIQLEHPLDLQAVLDPRLRGDDGDFFKDCVRDENYLRSYKK
jgi:hypothetical protein